MRRTTTTEFTLLNSNRSSEVSPVRTPLEEWLALLVFALVVRGGFLLAQSDNLTADPDGYRALAKSLQSSGQFARSDDAGPAFPTAYRPPLYPLLLAAVGGEDAARVWPVALVHLLLGIATVLGTFALARRRGLASAAWLAALLALFDPLLLNQSCLVMTETLAALITLAAVGALVGWSAKPTWHRAVLIGVAIGFCTLCRPTYLVWLGLVVAVVLARWRSDGAPRWHAAVMALAALLILSPWMMRNAKVLGSPTPTTTHGGYTLLLGNNPYFYRFVQERWWFEAWPADEFHFQWFVRRAEEASPGSESYRVETTAQELADDASAYRWAIESMSKQPAAAMLSVVYRWWQLMSPLPNRLTPQESRGQLLARLAVAVWYVAVYALAAIGVWRWGSGGGRVLMGWSLTLLIAFLLVHAFYWTNLRMRAPLMPIVCLIAAGGAQQIRSRLHARLPAHAEVG